VASRSIADEQKPISVLRNQLPTTKSLALSS